MKMDHKQFKRITDDLDSIKKLLALLLRSQKVRGDVIANAMGMTQGRLSQLISPPKNKRAKSDNTI